MEEKKTKKKKNEMDYEKIGGKGETTNKELRMDKGEGEGDECGQEGDVLLAVILVLCSS